MKRKNLRIPAATAAVMLSAVMILSGCGTGTNTSANATTDTIYGQITSTNDDKDTITLNVGTVDSDDNSDMELSGKSQTISVTDDTKYSSDVTNGNSNENGSGGPGGSESSGGPGENAGENSSGGSNGGSAPENGSSGNQSGAPSGQPGNGGNSQNGGTPPEMSGNSQNFDNSQNSTDQNGSETATSSDQSSQSASSADNSTSAEQGQNNNQRTTDGQSSSDKTDASAKSDSKSSDSLASSDKITFDSLKKGTKVAVTLDNDGDAKKVTILGYSNSSSQNGSVSYTSDNEISEDTALKNQTVKSTGTDEEAILVDDGATATLKNLKINRKSSDSTGGGNASFYGVGASVLTTEGTTYLSDSTITSDSKGGAGVFSYGSDSTAYVANTKITTKQDESGGIHVAGGGKLYAYDVTAETSGGSSAAIRSDRGGGTLVADGGSYTSNGSGSPAIYSTADITVHDADLTANGAEAVCIEGKNSIRLFGCNLTGNMPDDDQNDNTWNVILYQSMSGDSEEGNSTFEMVGGSLTAKNGGMFYSTNTQSTFILDDVDITYADENDYFLKVTGNCNQRGWGSSGSNGADTTFTAIKQAMQGNIIWDSISQLDFYMTNGSTLTGAVVDDESNAGNGGSGYANLYIENGSTWTVTGDSTLTNLYNAGTIQDADGNTVTIQGTDGTVYVQGTSQYTITVSSYLTSVDTSGASSVDKWSDYEVEEPSELK